MKIKFYPLLIACISIGIFSGCASTGPAGTWDYTVTDTPEGDFNGHMVIDREENGYSGYLTSNDMKIEFVRLDIEDDQVNASFYYDGNLLELTGEFVKKVFSGQVRAEYENYPMKAQKVE